MKLSPFKLERFFAQYEFKAPYLLSSSDCESITIEELLAYEPQAEEGLKKTWLGYLGCRKRTPVTGEALTVRTSAKVSPCDNETAAS